MRGRLAICCLSAATFLVGNGAGASAAEQEPPPLVVQLGEPVEGHRRSVRSVRFDGSEVRSMDSGGEVRRWSSITGEPNGAPFTYDDVDSLWSCLSPDGKTLLTVRMSELQADRTTQLVRIDAGGRTVLRTEKERASCRPAFSPTGDRAAFSGSRSVTVIDPAGGGAIRKVETSGILVDRVALAGDGTLVVASSSSEFMRVMEAVLKAIRQQRTPPDVNLEGLSHTREPHLQVFAPNADEGRKITGVQGTRIHALRVTADGRFGVFAGGDKGAVRVCDLRKCKVVRTLDGGQRWVDGLALDPQGKWIAAAGDGLRVWAWDDGSEALRLDDGDFAAVAFSADGRTVACGAVDGTVAVARLEEAAEPRVLGTGRRKFLHASLLRRGRQIVTVRADRRVELWDTATGERVRLITTAPDHVNSMAVSRDGRHLALLDSRLRAIDIDTGAPLQAWDPPPSRFLPLPVPLAAGLMFSGDGDHVLATCADEAVWVWHVHKPKGVLRIKGARTLAVAPRGDRIAFDTKEGLRVHKGPLVREPVGALGGSGYRLARFNANASRMGTVDRNGNVALRLIVSNAHGRLDVEETGHPSDGGFFGSVFVVVGSAGDRGFVRGYRAKKGLVLDLPASDRRLDHVQLDVTSRRIAVVQRDGTVDVRQLPEPK